jgi:Ribonuclease G/E
VRHALEAALANDPAKPQLLGWTRLGHIELMRPRRGRSLADALLEPNSRASNRSRSRMRRCAGCATRGARQSGGELAADRGARVAAALRGAAAPALQALETRLGRRIAIEAGPDREGFDIAPL